MTDATTADKCPNDSARAHERVRKFLDLSTGCLPHEEFEALEAEPGHRYPVCVVTPHEHGLWVFVHEEEEAVTERFPNLVRVIALARKHGCTWINFDRDSAAIEELPYWEW